VLGQGLPESELRRVEVASGGEQERSRAGGDRERPGAIEQARALLPGSQLPLRSLEVADPYYGGGEDFARCLSVVERACRGVVEHLRAELTQRSGPADGHR